MQPQQDQGKIMAAMAQAAQGGQQAAAPMAPTDGKTPQMVLKVDGQEITDPMQIIDYVNKVQESMEEKLEPNNNPAEESAESVPNKSKPATKEQVAYIMGE